MDASAYWLIGGAAVAAVAVTGAAIGVTRLTKKLFGDAFGRKEPDPSRQSKFLDGLCEKGYVKQVEVVKRGWAALSERPAEHVEITSHDGFTLRARLYEPDGPKFATVVLVHGYRSLGDMDFGCVYDFYREQGIGMLIVSQRAQNDSEGKYLTFGAKERFDVRDWCKFLVERYGEDHKIFLDGVSMGCSTVLLASALPDLPPQVKAVIADCGYCSAKGQIAQILREDMHLPVFPIVPVGSLLCRIYGGAFLGDAEVARELKKSKLPTLFVHGLADDFVRPYNSENNYRACGAEYKRLALFEGSPHGLSYLDYTEEYQGMILELLEHAGVLPAKK